MSTTKRQRRSKAKVKRSSHKIERVVAQVAQRTAMTLAALDSNVEIRAALVRRITRGMEKAPVLVLHQMAQVLEMWTAE